MRHEQQPSRFDQVSPANKQNLAAEQHPVPNHDKGGLITRRRFLSGITALAGAAALVACGDKNITTPVSNGPAGRGLPQGVGEPLAVGTAVPAAIPPATETSTAIPHPTETPLPPTVRPVSSPILATPSGTPFTDGTPSVATPSINPTEFLAPPLTLREAAKRQGKEIGTAISSTDLYNGDRLTTDLVPNEFTKILLPGLQWGSSKGSSPYAWHPRPEKYNFSSADQALTFAKNRGLDIAATFLWDWKGAYDPSMQGLPAETLNKYAQDALKRLLTETGYNNGAIKDLNVVNEVLFQYNRANGSENMFRAANGGSFEWMFPLFKLARELSPKTRLGWNEYGNEVPNKISDEQFAVAKQMRDARVPLDNIGIQMHVNVGTPPDPEQIYKNVSRFTKEGFHVAITEMSASLKGVTGTLEEQNAAQAQVIGDIVKAAQEGGCNDITFFGFTDAHDLTGDGPEARASLFGSTGERKPAYAAVFDLLNQPKKS